MFAGLPPWQRYLPLPILPPSTLSPPHPTCLLSQPPAPLLVPVSTLVRLLHTTSLHIAQLPIQHWIHASWKNTSKSSLVDNNNHPLIRDSLKICLFGASNEIRTAAPKEPEGSPLLDALASLDSKLSVGQWVIYRFQLAHLRVFQIIYDWCKLNIFWLLPPLTSNIYIS